jgi:subtilisin family serine protease
MKFRSLSLLVLFTLLGSASASAQNRIIVRSPGGLPLVQRVCALLGCNVVRGLDGTLNNLALVTVPSSVNPQTFLTILRDIPGITSAEVDQLVHVMGATATNPPAGLWDQTPVNYYGNKVWEGYANQPASQIIRLEDTREDFHVTGSGIVAVIDTGVDTSHPALRGVLLTGYDFTRNQSGASELLDAPSAATPGQGNPAQVNQSTVAVLDQSTVAVLDTNPQYAAFGHGTMTTGLVHLVAPRAKILPLKAFSSNGTGYLSDILRAVYYATQNHANVISMSWDFPDYSQELARAINDANRAGTICVAAAGNDGKDELVYPAALTNNVMGIASTSDGDDRSSFSNYGQDLVWIAAPGEAIISTYPFGTYAAGWGTSFSAPLVSGSVALLLEVGSPCNEYQAAQALAHAKQLSPDLNHGRLDLYQAISAWRSASGSHGHNHGQSGNADSDNDSNH